MLLAQDEPMSDQCEKIESLNHAIYMAMEELVDLEKRIHAVLGAAMSVSDHCTYPNLAEGLVFSIDETIKATRKARGAVHAAMEKLDDYENNAIVALGVTIKKAARAAERVVGV
jgi:hypothetical protein